MAALSLSDRFALAVIVLGSLSGMVFGFMIYEEQFAATGVDWWLFVPDCPLYVGLFALVAVLWALGIRNDFFGFLVAVGCMKYAAWTMFVLVFYGSYFFSTASTVWASSALLFVMHIGMMAEGLTLPFSKVSRAGVILVLAWFLLNDLVDYFGPAVHPFLPPGGDVWPAFAFGVASTLFFTGLALSLWSGGARIRIAGLSE